MNHKHILRTFTFISIYSVYRNLHIQVPTYRPAYIHHTYIDYQPQSGLGFRPSTKNKLNCALNLCWWWRNSCCRKHKVLHSSMRGFDIQYWLPCGTFIATPPPITSMEDQCFMDAVSFHSDFHSKLLKASCGFLSVRIFDSVDVDLDIHVFSMCTSARLFMPKAYQVWLDIWVKDIYDDTIVLCLELWKSLKYTLFLCTT